MMIVEQQLATAGPLTLPTDLICVCRLLSFTSTIAIYYYSAWKLADTRFTVHEGLKVATLVLQFTHWSMEFTMKKWSVYTI